MAMGMRRQGTYLSTRRWKGRKRNTQWGASGMTAQGALNRGTTIRAVIIPQTFLVGFASPTVVRIVGQVSVVQATSGYIIGAWGLTRTPEYLPLAQGPDPFDVGNAAKNQWMWWEPIHTVFDGTAIGATTRQFQTKVDVKSQRRLLSQDEISFCITNDNAGESDAVYHFLFRYLIKE